MEFEGAEDVASDLQPSSVLGEASEKNLPEPASAEQAALSADARQSWRPG